MTSNSKKKKLQSPCTLNYMYLGENKKVINNATNNLKKNRTEKYHST